MEHCYAKSVVLEEVVAFQLGVQKDQPFIRDNWPEKHDALFLHMSETRTRWLLIRTSEKMVRSQTNAD